MPRQLYCKYYEDVNKQEMIDFDLHMFKSTHEKHVASSLLCHKQTFYLGNMFIDEVANYNW